MSFADAHQHQVFETHELAQVEDNPLIWTMRRPNTGIFGLVLANLPTGLVLTGDLRFTAGRQVGPSTGNGAMWIPGYSLAWFGGDLNEDYLLEKTMKGAPSRRAAESSKTLAGWICAVQQKFAVLWTAHHAKEAAV